MRTLVIGDVHGHYDRLEELLAQEGIINDAGDRIDHGVKVVQLGDLGHFGDRGSPTGDLLCYRAADEWLDVVLWGNHDRAVMDAWHAFKGYQKPRPEIYHLMKLLEVKGKLRWADAAHGHLLTHAGLAMRFKNNRTPVDKTDPVEVARWLNGEFTGDDDIDRTAIRHAIGDRRGGSSPVGGILWRDIEENLWDGFPQVFGHSADHKKAEVRYVWKSGHTRKLEHVPAHTHTISYCVDVGGKTSTPGALGNSLAGIWLPSGDIVRVDL